MTRRGPAAMAAVAVILVVTDLVLLDQSAARTVPVATVAAALLIVLARRSGLAWRDMGLGRADLGSGLRWGSAVATIVVIGCVIVAVVPWFSTALADDRTPDSGLDVAVKVLLVIPLRTVLIEEVAFRGVIWGWVNREMGHVRATIVSSVGFGLWHVPQSFLIIDANDALSSAADGSAIATGAVVLGIVIVTGLSGVVFAELRRRSGSLIAPMALHLSVNAAATIVSFLA